MEAFETLVTRSEPKPKLIPIKDWNEELEPYNAAEEMFGVLKEDKNFQSICFDKQQQR
jgi:hypothetical protein